MLIKIYNKTGTLKAEVSPDSSSTQVKEIQGDNVLSLSFTLPRHIALDVDDYADFEGERYWLTRQYRPKQKSTVEWSYNLKMYGVESLIRNILVIKSVDGDDEPVFSLTASPREHVALIVSCLNRGFNTTDWKVGIVDGTDNVTIDYRGKYCDEALRELAEHVGVEYWAEGTTVNLCRCEHGESIALGYDKGLTSLDCGEASNVKFYTHLFPVGSSRNIDPAKYGSSRLHLPGNQRFVEVNADKYSRVDHYEESAFADVYPRYTGTVSSVRSEDVTDNDGRQFTIYYFKDDNLPFDPNDYEIGGLVKRISFQTGDLAGLGSEEQGSYYFEANFNSETREFEIITIWPDDDDDDMQLPGGLLTPAPGDKYIPWNIRMPDEYYPVAEAELLAAVGKYNDDHALDVAVYKAPTDHVWIEQNNVVLYVGRRVRLLSDKYFPGIGYRDSRITKITRKVNLPSQMDLEIGDALSRRTLDKVQDNISDMRNFVESGKAILPDLIRTGDTTLPTDSNAYSARRSDTQYLRKDRDDISEHGLALGGGVKVPDSRGSFVPDWLGTGARLWREDDGKTTLWVDRIYARDSLETLRLRFNMVDVIAGEQWQTFAYGTVESVDISTRTVMIERVEGEAMLFRPYDIMRGVFHNIPGVGFADANTNSTVGGDDDCGFPRTVGYSTAYITPVALVDADGNEITDMADWINAAGFVYRLRPGTKVHPHKGMKLAAYGNFSSEEWAADRHASVMSNTRRTVMMSDVYTWVLDPEEHYRYICGELEGITLAGDTLRGHGTYMHNAYIRGSVIQLTDRQRDELRGKDAYTVSMTSETGIIHTDAEGNPDTITGMMVAGKAPTAQYPSGSLHSLTTKGANVALPADAVLQDGVTGISFPGSDNPGIPGTFITTNLRALISEGYRLYTGITVHKGSELLTVSDDGVPGEGTYTIDITCGGCEAIVDGSTIYVTDVDMGKADHTVSIRVNCEGNTVITRTYRMTVVSDGTPARSQFTSYVFRRAATKPDRPAGGDYSSPLPVKSATDPEPDWWSDGPTSVSPVNPMPLWMTHRLFTSDGKSPQQAQWSEPTNLADTADFDVCYHDGESRPSPPRYHGTQMGADCNGWYNEATDDTIWMATSTYHNNEWSEWSIVRVKGETGARGDEGQGTLTAYVFRRAPALPVPARPTGGDYNSPMPDNSGWFDGPPGIDAGNPMPLWTSSRLFTTNGKAPQQAQWSEPTILVDSDCLDICYHDGQEEGGAPIPPPDSCHPTQDGSAACNGWYDEATDATVWMAIARREAAAAAWSPWSVIRIRGEAGQDAWRLDLDNERDSVLIDSDGSLGLPEEYLPKTNVRLFAGNTPLELGNLAIVSDGLSDVAGPSDYGWDPDHGEYSIYYLRGMTIYCYASVWAESDWTPHGMIRIVDIDPAMLPDKTVLTIEAAGAGDRADLIGYASWTVIRETGNCIYRLIPEVSQLHADCNGVLIDPLPARPSYLRCHVQRVDRNGSALLPVLPSGLDLRADLLGARGGSLDIDYPLGVRISDMPDDAEGYLFRLYDVSGDDEIMLDRETIPVVRDGRTGGRGLPGCQLRLWKSIYGGQEFVNDTIGLSAGTTEQGYVDYLAVRSTAQASGWNVYKLCVKGYTASAGLDASAILDVADTPGTNDGLRSLLGSEADNWEAVDFNMASGFFNMLIANYALIDVLAGTQFLVRDEHNVVVGGLQGARNGDTPIFWAGAENPGAALVRIYADGHIEASASLVVGDPDGKRIEIQRDSADIKIFDADGNLRAILSGNPLTEFDFRGDDMETVSVYDPYGYIGDTGGSWTQLGRVAMVPDGVSGQVKVDVWMTGRIILQPASETGGGQTVFTQRAVALDPIWAPTVSISVRIVDGSGRSLGAKTLCWDRNDSTGYPKYIDCADLRKQTLTFQAVSGTEYYLEYYMDGAGFDVDSALLQTSASQETSAYLAQIASNGFLIRRSSAESFGVFDDSTGHLEVYRNGIRQPFTIFIGTVWASGTVTAMSGYVNCYEHSSVGHKGFQIDSRYTGRRLFVDVTARGDILATVGTNTEAGYFNVETYQIGSDGSLRRIDVDFALEVRTI